MYGMSAMTLAWTGSGGVGLSLYWTIIVTTMTTGSTNQGSGVARSCTQKIHGALRVSTLATSTQYRAMNTGICTRIGRQPPSGLIFSVLYSSIIATFIFC